MSADELRQTTTGAQGKTTPPTMVPVDNVVPDITDSTSSDDSEPFSDNLPVTPSDLPPPLLSSLSEPVKPTLKPHSMLLPHNPGRGGQQSGGGGLRAPLMGNTSSTPIPPSLQAKLAAVSVSPQPLPRSASACVISGARYSIPMRVSYNMRA
jgi:hypothetical protein